MTEPAPLRRPRGVWPLALVGILAGALLATSGFIGIGGQDRTLFFRAYLFAWLFCLGLSLGGLCLMMLHNLTGGEWGAGIREAGGAASRLLPLMALLFIPILFGLPALYPWARPGETSPVLVHRHPYFALPFFFGRAILYFVIWCGLAFLLDSWQRSFTRNPSVRLLSRIRGLSAAGLILYLWTMTHAGVDWIMSRDIEFYSTTFGFILTTGQTLAAMAFAIVFLGPARANRRSALALAARTPEEAPSSAGQYEGGFLAILNDVGNVLLTLVILWAYVSFMQLLVIWMGNTREDNTWYTERGLSQPDPWRWIGLFLVICHFFVPFYLLLFRRSKQYLPSLIAIGWVLLIGHIVEVYWLVAPSGHGGAPRFAPHWLDALAFVAIGCLWLAGFLWLLPHQWGASPLVHEATPARA